MSQPLWTPSEEKKEKAVMTAYMRYLSKEKGLQFKTYRELWDWSVQNRADFWSTIWKFGDVRASGK